MIEREATVIFILLISIKAFSLISELYKSVCTTPEKNLYQPHDLKQLLEIVFIPTKTVSYIAID